MALSIWTATTSPSVSQACAFLPSAPWSWMICVSLHSKATGLSATRGTLTSLPGAAVSPAILNSLTSRATCAAVAFICFARSMVARFQTNSPVSWILLDAVLPVGGGEADDRRVIAEGVEEAVGREVDVALGIARGNPADRARRDDGVEGIVLEAVAVRGLVEMQVFVGHGGLLVIRSLRHRGAKRSAIADPCHVALRRWIASLRSQ